MRCSVAIRVAALTNAPSLTYLQPRDAVERRADLGLRDLRVRERELGAAYVQVVQSLVVVVGNDETLREQLGDAALAPLRQRDLVRCGEAAGLQVGVVELHEQRASARRARLRRS